MKKLNISLLSKIAHEMLSPLVSSRWGLRIVLDGKTGEISDQTRQYLMNMNANLDRMDMIVGKLINLAKIDINELKTNPTQFDVIPLINGQIEAFSHTNGYPSIKNVSNLKSARVFADKEHVGFMIKNILHNALVYSKEDDEVEVNVSERDKDVKIDIKDNGIGIPKKDRTAIFDLFVRGSNVKKAYPKGVGISLFVVKNMVDKWDGQISIRSTKGEGTLFTITIPKGRKK